VQESIDTDFVARDADSAARQTKPDVRSPPARIGKVKTGRTTTKARSNKAKAKGPKARNKARGGKDKRAKKSKLSMSSLREILGYSAAGGALIYAVLFVTYWSYYSHLGIRPEDVGISHPFILARSIGLISLIAVISAMIGILVAVLTGAIRMSVYSKLLAIIAVVISAAVLIVWLYLTNQYIHLLLPKVSRAIATEISIALVVPSYCLVGVWGFKLRSKPLLYGGIFSAALMTIVLPVGATVLRAHQLGTDAAQGRDVKSFSVLGIPVLDVSSDPAVLTWVCLPDQRPSFFPDDPKASLKGHLLGGSATSVIFMGNSFQKGDDLSTNKPAIIHPIHSFPQLCVMVTHIDTEPG
jgi:hypothetical protein